LTVLCLVCHNNHIGAMNIRVRALSFFPYNFAEKSEKEVIPMDEDTM
jgi:hypothetical protein